MAFEIVFATVGIIILLGFLSDLIFSKTNIPDVLWLILIGVLIGPVLNFVRPESLGQAASIFTSFALLFILFEGGLHIRIKDLMKSMYGATTLTAINFMLTVTAVTIIAKFFGWSLTNSLLLGTILGGTSSAVVVPIVKKLKMGKDNALKLILESAFTDVLCIVATLTIVQIVTLDKVDPGAVLNALFGSFAIAIFVGLIAGFLWILLLDRFQQLSKSYISTIGILLIVSGISEFAHSSGAIAALSFGIVMGNSRKILSLAEGVEEEADPLSSSARAFFSQISFFVKTFFFVYIGILVSMTEYYLIWLGFLIAAAVFLMRPISVKFSYKPEQPLDRPIMESMIPKGLAAAVLAQIPMQMGILNAEQLLTPVISAIFFTIAITTIMVFLTEKGKYRGTTALYLKLIGKKYGEKSGKTNAAAPKKTAAAKKSATKNTASGTGKPASKQQRKKQAKAPKPAAPSSKQAGTATKARLPSPNSKGSGK
ncbi:cation:proton antiporter [Candidatus Woesearchaeota archaeon]|nr:cation:proton antiporter [Candidatus Woesearchaeota archaeon]